MFGALRLRPMGLVACTVISLGVFTAAYGSGGSASPGVANLGSTTTSISGPSGASGSSGNIEGAQLNYAKCMQIHGEPDYPEPVGNPATNAHELGKLDPNSPRFQSAEYACRGHLPKGAPVSPRERAKVLTEALRFAHCMQTHGMPNWPEPSARGYMVAPVGAAADSPTYLKAAKICKPLLPNG